MELDTRDATDPGIALPIPRRGLDEVVRGWSGQGLWEALAAIDDPLAERRWDAHEIQRRAHRILMQQLVPQIETWPTNANSWLDALPAESQRRSTAGDWPRAGTDWPATRRGGWPPRSFIGRTRRRLPATLLATTLRWTLERLASVRADAARVEANVVAPIRPQLACAQELLRVEPIASAEAVQPTKGDLEALHREGRPWHALVPVAESLRRLDATTALDLAWYAIWPTEELRWRLFHLGVLGEVLVTLRELGASMLSLRPLSAASAGPAYSIAIAEQQWDLWFEATGLWAHYGHSSPYVEAVQSLVSAPRPLGPDILLMSPDRSALVIECKYPRTVGTLAALVRDGYHQAATYAVETRSRLAPRVRSVAVVPEGVGGGGGCVATVVGHLGVVDVSGISGLVRAIVTNEADA